MQNQQFVLTQFSNNIRKATDVISSPIPKIEANHILVQKQVYRYKCPFTTANYIEGMFPI